MDAATDGVGRGTADFTGCCSRVTGSFFGVGLASTVIGAVASAEPIPLFSSAAAGTLAVVSAD